MFGHLSFSLRAMPVIVPPVPAPATSMSTLPVWKGQKKEAILKVWKYRETKSCCKFISSKSCSHRHIAPGSPRPWCRSEPGGCLGCGTGPGCASWGSRSWGARPHPHETRANRNERWWVYGQSQLRELSGHPPAQRNPTQTKNSYKLLPHSLDNIYFHLSLLDNILCSMLYTKIKISQNIISSSWETIRIQPKSWQPVWQTFRLQLNEHEQSSAAKIKWV